MSKAMMTSTQQIAVTLSLNIVTQTDNDPQLITLPLVQLTPILFWLLSIRQTLNRVGFVISQGINEAIEPLRFLAKVVSIGFVSLTFGLGVEL